MANTSTCDRRYVAPEFMFDAIMSAKVDVYSFGMLVLETITMRRMPDYKSMFTLDYVSTIMDHQDLCVCNI